MSQPLIGVTIVIISRKRVQRQIRLENISSKKPDKNSCLCTQQIWQEIKLDRVSLHAPSLVLTLLAGVLRARPSGTTLRKFVSVLKSLLRAGTFLLRRAIYRQPLEAEVDSVWNGTRRVDGYRKGAYRQPARSWAGCLRN